MAHILFWKTWATFRDILGSPFTSFICPSIALIVGRLEPLHRRSLVGTGKSERALPPL
jgi:hypothetical protein